MKTILVPVDFSRVTPRVAAFAAKVTRRIGGRMVLLNVTQPRAILKNHGKLLDLVGFISGSESLNPENEAPVAGDSLELLGSPARVILEEAQRLEAEYIVMGTCQRRHTTGPAVGRVAQRVIRGAPCPVILVPAFTSVRPRTASKSYREKPLHV